MILRRLLSALFLLWITILHVSAFEDEQVHVLFLNSYDARMSWYNGILQGVEEILRPDLNSINLHLEHLDSKEFGDNEYYAAYAEFLSYKYRAHELSLILCSDNNSLDFLIRFNHELFHDTPIVFCGVNDFEDSMIRGHDEITGIAEVFSARETVELALSLHPETEEIYIINDYLNTGRAWQRDIAEQLASLEDMVRLRYSENLSMEELTQTIADLPKNSIVLLGVYYSDREGRFSTYEETGKIISRASAVPIYCLVEFNLYEGVIGGKLLSGVVQGRTMAQMGMRILGGEDPAEIPIIKEGANQFVFNYSGLERFHISEKDLPEDSQVVNRPFSVYREYLLEIWISITGFGILILTLIALVVNTIARKKAEDSLRDLAEATWEAILIHHKGTAVNMNDVFVSMFGYSREEVMVPGFVPQIFSPESYEIVQEKIEEADIHPYEVRAVRKDGTEFPVEVRIRLMEYKGLPVRVAAFRDLTEQKRMEERITQSQKMQAIGTLAGGIAHDFNNILSGVLGFADLGLMSSEPESRQREYFSQILAAGKRARELVRQILSFSRQSSKTLQPVIFSDIINETLELLRATLPSTIRIHKELDSSVCIQADPVQLQQIVMNLCTNAGLAMKEEGGELELVLSKQMLRSPELSGLSLAEGDYASLTVSDTGCGMPEAVRKRIFEPFFTTREQGEGSGMGLSVVHGIISAMSGNIHVYSEEGQGTSFTILLPLCSLDTVARSELKENGAVKGGSERILFVDDEIQQTALAKEMLSSLGYRISVANNGREALRLFSYAPDSFDILISDVTMPEMTGDVLVEKVRALRPELPVLLCSGYSERLSSERLASLKLDRFVMKPLMLKETAALIRAALDEGNPRS